MRLFRIVAISFCLLFTAPLFGGETKRVILIQTMTLEPIDERVRGWIAEMDRLGYKEGDNLELVLINAQKDVEIGKTELKKAIDEKRPDLIVAIATIAAKAAKEVTKDSDIPVLFSFVSDPVGSGITKSVAGVSGENITGTIDTLDRKKRLGIIESLLGERLDKGVVKIVLLGTTYPSSKGDMEQLLKIAENIKNIEFIPFSIEQRPMPEGSDSMIKEVLAGLDALKDRADFVWNSNGPLLLDPYCSEKIIKHSPLPFIYDNAKLGVKNGAFLALFSDGFLDGKESAQISKKILEGESVGNIPLKPSDSFKYCANIKSMLEHNIIIPPELLKTVSDDCIYK